MNMNPPHPNTPWRKTKLFFPLAFVFCQNCLAFSDGGLRREQYQRHKFITDILNHVFEAFKSTVGIRRYQMIMHFTHITTLRFLFAKIGGLSDMGILSTAIHSSAASTVALRSLTRSGI